MPQRNLASILAALCALWAGVVLPGSASAFCFEEAAARYRVPVALLETIAELESGLDPEAVHWNADGSLDVGLMQVNSAWEAKLGSKRWEAVCTDPCYNVLTGAWVLADCLIARIHLEGDRVLQTR